MVAGRWPGYEYQGMSYQGMRYRRDDGERGSGKKQNKKHSLAKQTQPPVASYRSAWWSPAPRVPSGRARLVPCRCFTKQKGQARTGNAAYSPDQSVRSTARSSPAVGWADRWEVFVSVAKRRKERWAAVFGAQTLPCTCFG